MRTEIFSLMFAIAMSSLHCGQRIDSSHDDNTSTMNQPGSPDNSLAARNPVVFMGNSIIQAWPNFTPDFWSDPSRINRGIGGQTTGQMLDRFQRDVIDPKPGVVVILAGTNDIAQNNGPVPLETIRDNIFDMCSQARDHEIRVILCSILPVQDYPWRTGLQPAKKIVQVNTWLRAYAKKNDIAYIDFHSRMADPENGMITDLAYDGVHPNKKGYELMVKVMAEAASDLFGR